MPEIVVHTDPLKTGSAQMPVFVVGDDQNWSLQFHNGVSLYNPTGVLVRLGYVFGLDNLSFPSAFQWIDRMNNRHIGSFAIAAGVPGSLTWDENPIGVFGGDGAWILKGRTPPSSQVRKVNVLAGGTGYSSAPRVDFNGGWASQSGKGATAVANRGGGSTVTAITVTDPGHNYSTPPYVLISGGGGAGATARATVTSGQITAVTVLTAGTGYTSDPTVTFVDPEASATASIAGSSAIAALILAAGGSGYTSAPTVGFTGGGGASAAATATLAASAWPVASLTLTNQGSGYTSAPTVGFTGGGGTGAEAVATINRPDALAAITVTNPGVHTYGPPYITFSGGGGSGAAAHAEIDFYTRAITAIVIDNPGYGYTSAPTVIFTPVHPFGGDGGAAATAVLGDGKVATLTLTNPGSGYTSAPTVSFTGGGGTSAAATAVLTGSPVASLTITNAGSGYTSLPTISFTGGGGIGAAATAQLSLGITAITLTQGGFAYTSLPSVTVHPNNGVVLEPAGIDTNPVPYLRNMVPSYAVDAVNAIPYSRGRRDSSGNLLYDDSLLIIRPRIVLTPTFALGIDGLTWAAVFTPVTAFVSAVLNFRRSCTMDIEIFGGGRLLYKGALTVLKKIT